MGYCPCWDDVQFVAKDVAIKNEWKTNFLSYNWEDLLQEGWFVFKNCLSKNNTYENKWHFLSFFKVSFNNKIIDLVKYKKSEKELNVDFKKLNDESDEILTIESIPSKDSSDFELKLRQAPEHVRVVINLLVKIPIHKIKINRITNNKLCEMLGYDPNKINLITEVKIYFKER